MVSFNVKLSDDEQLRLTLSLSFARFDAILEFSLGKDSDELSCCLNLIIGTSFGAALRVSCGRQLKRLNFALGLSFGTGLEVALKVSQFRSLELGFALPCDKRFGLVIDRSSRGRLSCHCYGTIVCQSPLGAILH